MRQQQYRSRVQYFYTVNMPRGEPYIVKRDKSGRSSERSIDAGDPFRRPRTECRPTYDRRLLLISIQGPWTPLEGRSSRRRRPFGSRRWWPDRDLILRLEGGIHKQSCSGIGLQDTLQDHMLRKNKQQHRSEPITKGSTTGRGAEDRYAVAAASQLAYVHGRYPRM